ncbi:hypothetical protein P8Q88_10010 [Qipengyuania sp. XHP0207]|uniref:hypothetical protein n=1 Tax=Qipengyuania sp. XHP0207 TaxID=3038078 RepID=UPI00241C97AC|nr:hypothetical protein [Qipengyuania sp. XHP0207]MDG5748515.1 hypothetical protein [Qipengyuania sp. XHP0207]
MKSLSATPLLFVLGACAIIPDTPRVDGDAQDQGSAIGINQAVWAGDTILKPLAVTEDSRCPVDAECVWAGKLVVSTRITATHWTQTAPLTLGEPYEVMGRTYELVEATPDRRATGTIGSGDYRFVFARR